ncbi:MAG TPA: DUF3782 domain-containing protein [Cyanobacteria bacterium UBA8156]|nr:DUF3782 domain-containing protein [Cyanobacteria bacterium UBA8156]
MSQPITIEDIYKLFAASQQELAASRAEYDRRAAEADRRAADADRRAAQADAQMAELRRTVTSLTTRWGRFVEELVEPAVLRLFQARGIDVKEVYPRARVRRQGLAMEIDILAVDDTELVVVECKSRLSQDDVDAFLGKLARFKDAFPHYRGFRAYGAVAAIEIKEGVDRYGFQRGLFVIRPSGDTVAIANGEDFRPQIW